MNPKQVEINARCRQNIRLFEAEIDSLNKSIRDYTAWISRADRGEKIEFDSGALKRGIVSSKEKISILEAAIERERQTMRDYQEQLQQIEDREALIQSAIDNVHVELEYVGEEE